MLYQHCISTITPDGSVTISAAVEPDATYAASLRASQLQDRTRHHGRVSLSLTADQCRHLAEELLAIADNSDASQEG